MDWLSYFIMFLVNVDNDIFYINVSFVFILFFNL